MALPNANIATNKVSAATRWLKLYRTLFHRFLKIDFIHKADYLRELQQLNARITQLETALNTTQTQLMTAISLATTAHTHVAPQAPAGAIPTGPGIVTTPPTPPVPSATALVVHADTILEQKDAALQATGPAIAPLGDGLSPESVAANVQIKQDIGLT